MLQRRANGGVFLALAVSVVGLGSTHCGGSSQPAVSPPTGLAYSANPAVYTVGTAIAANTPTNTGGAITSYSVAPGLPAGLNLDTSTGIISGTPTAAAAVASYVVTGTNSAGSTTASVSITVNNIAPTNLTYGTNPAVYTVGTAIAQNKPANAGGSIDSYSVTPALPAGLSLSTTTGIISGTPTAIAAQATYTVKGTNSVSSTTVGVVITVNDAKPTNLAYATNPAVYTISSAIAPNTPSSGGGAVVSYSVAPPLPAGLSFDTTTGIVSGTPTAITAQGTYTVTATNTGGSDTVGLVITVNDLPPANLTYSSNPAVYTKGVAITPNTPSHTGGGVGQYSVLPALPAGLSLDPTTGIISGTPTGLLTTAGTFVVTAQNSVGNTTASVSITINDVKPSGLSYSLNPAVYTKGTAITPNTPSTTGGGPVTSYSVLPATLPAGLAFNTTTGVISGTPTVLQTTPAIFAVTATNSGGNSTAVNVSITINDVKPSGLSYSLNPAVYTKGTAITPNTPSTTGGGPVTSYSVLPATLPAGLAFNTTTGVISGTPTVLQTTPAIFAVTATNSGGNSTAVNVSITINDAVPTGLSYSLNPAVYTKGTAITPNTPSTTGGGAPTSYSVLPATLPAGLAFNTTTGIISGTPTVLQTMPAIFAVTPTNSGGNGPSVNVSITINDAVPTGLSYSANPAVYTKGMLITNNTPSTTGGGPPTSYSVSPALPAGLAFNTTTGVISGTPTVLLATSNFAVTPTNSGGNGPSVNVSITINDVAPTGLSYSANPAVYTVGTAIPQNIPTLTGGGPVVSYSVLPAALPAGLSFNTTTGVISGIPTAVTTTSIFAVKATNSGGSANANVSITVNVVLPTRYALVANENDNTLSAYTVDANTGLLRANGYALTGMQPRTVTVHPTGKFAYVANIGDNTISTYAINASTGQLVAVGAPVATGARPFSVTVDPKGKFAYAVNFDGNTVSGYTINASTGALTSTGAAIAAGTNPSAVAVDPTGRFVYVTNQGGGVSAYSITAATGVLVSLGTATAGTLPSYVTVDPTGRFVYVTNETTNNISAFSIGPTGALTSLGANVGGGTAPSTIAVAPSGKFAYVTNTTANVVTLLSINTTSGVLTNTGTTATAPNPVSVTVDPSGDFLYVSNFDTNNVSAFSVNTSTGVLTSIQTMGARVGATSFALAQGTAAVAYVPKFAYAANSGGNTLSQYTVGGTGALTHIGTDIATGQGVNFVAVDPFNRFAYTANGSDGTVSVYTIGSGGTLTAGTAVTAGAGARAVVVDPSGRFVYSANNVSGDVSAFTIGTAGALTSIAANIASGSAPFAITVDPTGRFLYVANQSGTSIAAFTIDPVAGGLTKIGTANAVAGNSPVSVVVDPTGRFAYCVNEDDNTVQLFNIDSGSGALTPGATLGTGMAPRAIGMDPVGAFLYVANGTSNDVWSYSINTSNGALASIGSPIAAGTLPHSCTVDPSGSFLYAANSGGTDDSLSTYGIASGGTLTSLGAVVPAGANPISVAVSGVIQ
jgi:6-phosphogluconolactonase (cycloisomerase 2 family)